MKSCLEKNAIEMYYIQNEEKSVVAKRFFRTLKSKIYKYMTPISKNVCIDKLDEYHRTTKIKPVDVKPTVYTDFNKENNKEGPKFKVGCHVRISTYKNIFAESYVPN